VTVGGKSLSLSIHTEEFISRALGKVQKGDSSSQKTHLLLTKNEIVKMRAKAVRRGIWFKVLSKAERAYIELTIRVVNGVRNYFLAKVLASIIRRLLNDLESKVANTAKKVGQSLAQKLSGIARSWGNVSAIDWAEDFIFIRYLGILHLNTAETSVV